MKAVIPCIALAWMLGASAAVAHPTDTFDLCAKPKGVAGEPCVNRVEVGRGAKVVFRADVRPSHADARARVWQLRPHADWEKVDIIDVTSDGRARWRWTPREDDIFNYTSWRFRFVIPSHGTSDTVMVRVRSDEF